MGVRGLLPCRCSSISPCHFRLSPVFERRPASVRKSTDFPAPLGPTITVIFPAWIVSLAFFNSGFPAAVIDKSWSCNSIGGSSWEPVDNLVEFTTARSLVGTIRSYRSTDRASTALRPGVELAIHPFSGLRRSKGGPCRGSDSAKPLQSRG